MNLIIQSIVEHVSTEHGKDFESTFTYELNMSNKRRRLGSGTRSPTSTASFPSISTFEDIEAVDDIFLNVISFFVGRDAIDAESILRMMQVSKRWNSTTCSQTFWRQQAPRLKNGTYGTLLARLIRYQKIQKLPCKRHHQYKVIDRATNKIYRLEINPPERNDQGQPQCHLREVCILNHMDQLSSQYQRHLSLVEDWDMCHGYTLYFHEYAEETLQSYLDKYDVQPHDIKAIILGILQGLHALHKCSLTHRNLTMDRIAIVGGASSGGDSVPIAKVVDFKYCKGDYELNADNCYTVGDLMGDQFSCGVSADIDSVGRFFLAMIHAHRHNGCYSIAKDIDYEDMNQIIGNDGVDLLKGLVNQDSERRISISDALQHPYFVAACTKCVASSSTGHNHRLQLLNAMEVKGRDCYDVSDIIRFKPSQAAGMVDWLFEIASVFHISTRTVFVAVGFYNRCCHHSIVERILGKGHLGIKKCQLLAATCLHIASKCVDDIHVHAASLSFSADRTFDQADIFALEHKILDSIEWKLSMPTIYDFATCYLEMNGIQSDSTLFWLTLYICELSLESTMHLDFSPSMIAASASVLAKYSCQESELWTENMATFAKHTWVDLKKCILKLSQEIALRRGNQQNSMIYRRYSKSTRMRASAEHIKQIQSFAQLEAMNPNLS